MKRRSKKPKIELPDCILSIIFSKLGLKDLVKTSALSKRWLQEWRLRMDLNFDLQNMFELRYNTVQELPKSLPLLQGFQSEFAKRLDQFMLHYQDDMISSIRVNFPLGDEYRSVIGRLISQGIAKGAKSIELLLSYETNDRDFVVEIEPYKFSMTLLSHTDSLTNLHLQKCCLVAPMDFSAVSLPTARVPPSQSNPLLQDVAVRQQWCAWLFSRRHHLLAVGVGCPPRWFCFTSFLLFGLFVRVGTSQISVCFGAVEFPLGYRLCTRHHLFQPLCVLCSVGRCLFFARAAELTVFSDPVAPTPPSIWVLFVVFVLFGLESGRCSKGFGA
ncbi:putative F-box domain-containing protein [Medicago truncatula]|uniref:F-box protein n=1 Tax=Medicago truncatula TaxID=3880 RepID=A0A072U3R8_MEDTR|nr:F-box protein [Medicago truncatula]RHN48101.1 putative F-box domain-containing protein [Medicago truncatula]